MTTANIQVGDRVRSFDFPGGHSGGFQVEPHQHACYVEGTVRAIDRFHSLDGGSCKRYQIQVERKVFAGRVLSPEEVKECYEHSNGFVYPPVNGVTIIGGLDDDEVTSGVRKVEG